MSKKLTHEEFIARVIEKNEHVRNGEIDILGQYRNAKTPIECQCVNDHTWSAMPAVILMGCGCPYCAGRHKTNQSIQDELDKMGEGVKIVSKYFKSDEKVDFQCANNHIWSARIGDIFRGRGCPYCAGKKVIDGETSLLDTRPDIAELLKNKEDARKYSAGSGKKVWFVCPDCGTECFKTICDVCTYGFSCKKCADGISWPNKFMFNILSQLKVDFEREITKTMPGFEWVGNYRYDFCIRLKDRFVLVEMDGQFHFCDRFRSYEETHRIDELKNQMAIDNGIELIRIDCNYVKDNRFEYIKNNILTSKLSIILDLSDIDWIKCDREAQKKLVVEVAKLYNNGLSMQEIKSRLNFNIKTIRKWLKQATNVGLCDYSAKEMRIRGGKTITVHNIAINQYTIDGKYVNNFISMAEAEKVTGISKSNICVACDKPNRSAGGYRWYIASNPDQPDKTKIILTIQN